MLLRFAVAPLAVLALVAPATASAEFVHVVAPGESLTSIAATDGLTVAQLAAANGISPFSELIAGTTVVIPPQTGTGSGTGTDAGSAAGGSPGGSYVVQPGDTLTAIAERAGMTVDELAGANGLDPDGVLLSGAVLSLSGSDGGGPRTSFVSDSGRASDAATSEPEGDTAEGSSTSPPYPTPERLSASEIGSIASYEGVPPALAEAIAWQESGFNNDLVSVDDARGVMQILPGTWNWIGQDLATPPPLGSASAAQNVRAGTLMLHSLLAATGGNQELAAAGYYQGLPSVEQNGMYSSTQQYVNDVMSLEQQFGGG